MHANTLAVCSGNFVIERSHMACIEKKEASKKKKKKKKKSKYE